MRTVSGKLIAYTSLLRESVPVGTRVIGMWSWLWESSIVRCCYMLL